MSRYRSSVVRAQRGATAIEYALLAAALLIPLVVAIEVFEQKSGVVIQDGGDRIGTPAEYSEGVPIP